MLKLAYYNSKDRITQAQDTVSSVSLPDVAPLGAFFQQENRKLQLSNYLKQG